MPKSFRRRLLAEPTHLPAPHLDNGTAKQIPTNDDLSNLSLTVRLKGLRNKSRKIPCALHCNETCNPFMRHMYDDRIGAVPLRPSYGFNNIKTPATSLDFNSVTLHKGSYETFPYPIFIFRHLVSTP